MTQVEVLQALGDQTVRGGYRVDVTRGERIGRVSSEWSSRPSDERFLSLSDLAHTVRDRAERSRTRVVESGAIRVEARRDDPERLSLLLPEAKAPVAPTHWSFGQLASLVGAPAAYLRQLPAPLAAINLQYGLTSNRAEQVKTLETEDGRVELRAVTGPDYGRIFDHELVEAVQRIAGTGTGAPGGPSGGEAALLPLDRARRARRDAGGAGARGRSRVADDRLDHLACPQPSGGRPH